MGLVTHSTGKRKRRNRAFTLIELLVVIAIIGILMGLISGMAVFAKRKASEARTRAELNQIAKLVEEYRANHGIYPSMSKYADLIDGSLKDEGYLLPEGADGVDSWDNPYVYVYQKQQPLVYELWSWGHDRKPETPDDLYAGR